MAVLSRPYLGGDFIIRVYCSFKELLSFPALEGVVGPTRCALSAVAVSTASTLVAPPGTSVPRRTRHFPITLMDVLHKTRTTHTCPL
eukprot:SAG11_NODE_1091_length_5910_cov_4.332817_4_plen_87_part_00